MIDIGHSVITAVLDKDSADKLCRYLKGCRVSFSKREIEHSEMNEYYNEMVKLNTKNSEIVKAISSQYDITIRQAQRMVKKWKEK